MLSRAQTYGGVEVVIGQLQRVIVAEFTQDGPGGSWRPLWIKRVFKNKKPTENTQHMWKCEWSSLIMM